MAEENEVSSVPEKQKTESKEESVNSNDIELIDLSNDEEEQSKHAEEENDNEEDDDKEIQNGNDENEEDANVQNENSNEVSNQKGSDDEIMISDDDDEDDDEEEEPEQETMEIIDDEDDDASQEKCETSDNIYNENHTSKKVNSQSTKDEITIDDDDDDEVQDLSTKSNSSLEDLVPKISNEQLGFPTCFKDVISLGECIAINKKSRSDIDIDKEYSILDCPSQVVPLIIKRSNKFPSKIKADKDESKQVNPPSTAPNQNTKNMLTISDFYSSSIGKFLIGVGLSRVKQWYHKDTINKVRKQIRKEGEAEDLIEELKKQQDYFNSCRAANSSYTFPAEKCEHCDFRTEFKLVLNNHLNYPHTTARKELKCNYCQFSTRDSKVIIGHVNVLHEKKCFIELPPQLYECPICPYESGVKSKAATHIAKCLKFFVPDKLLVNKDDYFPTITPKPITQEDIKIYEATLQALRFAALNPQNKVPQIPGLPSGLQQNVYSAQQQMARTGRPKAPQSKNARQISPFLMNQVNLKNVSPQLYQMLSNAPHGQFLQNPSAAQGFSSIQANPLISKHQQMLAKMNQLSTANAANRSPHNVAYSKPNIIAKQQNNNATNNRVDNANPKGSFVMCEICDGYIKDLEQLRTHMHWIHKVRIHPKMLASRPPLNCQKCQWRFFTDQGLERHLLGAHGLVTSNMQDMVNQNQDGGRCTICGRVFTNKLVTHMNQTHKINLKPAHLSYKCTVCSATFNLYRLFENHVYMVHSGSVKRNANDDSNQPPRKKAALDSIAPQAAAAANGN